MDKLRSILLIDDDPIANFLNKSTIENLNVTDHLTVLEDGLEGINYLNALCENDICPDLILLDLNMPVMDGLEFLKVFKNLDYAGKNNTKIVVLTTSTNSRDIEAAVSLGCDDYLTKPLADDKLKGILEKFFLAKELK